MLGDRFLDSVRGDPFGPVLRGALAQVLAVLAIGISVALAGGRMLSSLLYGVKSQDAVILGSANAILVACAVFAALVPAGER